MNRSVSPAPSRWLFTTFARTGSACATVKAARREHLAFPRRCAKGAHKGELLWGLETIHAFFGKLAGWDLPGATVVANLRHCPERGFTKVGVCTWDRPGLLAKIADNADVDGYAYPGEAYLARQTGFTKRSVISAIRRLREAGELGQGFGFERSEKHARV